jgi:hypothetical protein
MRMVNAAPLRLLAAALVFLGVAVTVSGCVIAPGPPYGYGPGYGYAAPAPVVVTPAPVMVWGWGPRWHHWHY